MKPLYIVGAGGAAKEIWLLIKDINEIDKSYKFKGFVDIGTQRFLKIGESQYDIINESDFLNRNLEKAAVIFGLGDVDRIKKVVELYRQKENLEFPNIIHPNVKLDKSISLGLGNIIASQCVFTIDTSLGSFNYINRGVHVGHDCKIGSYNVINPCAVISGGINIGNENLIGTNATILQYLKIGSKNKIGGGAVVINYVEDNCCMVGVPAKNKK